MKEGSRTPWGPADYVDVVAPGIWIVGTPSHGGVKLSPALNAGVPIGARRDDGWYEEDCDANIAIVCYPVEFRAWWAPGKREGDIVTRAWEALTHWNLSDWQALVKAGLHDAA